MSKTIVKKIRVSVEDAERIEQDAKKAGKNFSTYMRDLTRQKPNEHPEVIKVFNKLINEMVYIL